MQIFIFDTALGIGMFLVCWLTFMIFVITANIIFVVPNKIIVGGILFILLIFFPPLSTLVFIVLTLSFITKKCCTMME